MKMDDTFEDQAYLPLFRYLRICSFSRVAMGTLKVILSTQWSHSVSVYFSGKYKVWQLPHFLMYNFLPACNSERLAVAVSLAVDGIYRADAQENAMPARKMKTNKTLEHKRKQ